MSLNALLSQKGVIAVLPTLLDEILLYRALLVVPVFCQSYWFFDVICLNLVFSLTFLPFSDHLAHQVP